MKLRVASGARIFVKALSVQAIVWFDPTFQGRTSTEEYTYSKSADLAQMRYRRYALLNLYSKAPHGEPTTKSEEKCSYLCEFLRTDSARECHTNTSNQFLDWNECVRMECGQNRVGSVRWAASTYDYNHQLLHYIRIQRQFIITFFVDKQWQRRLPYFTETNEILFEIMLRLFVRRTYIQVFGSNSSSSAATASTQCDR